jgi:threo-3-hydroxy-L-aspartate ammonia-lyase
MSPCFFTPKQKVNGMITLQDIYAARERLRGVALHTPLIPLYDDNCYFKPESFQPIGSFKIRGAYNRIAALMKQKPSGVIAYSSGNHAQGVAYSAQKLGLPATIVMPQNAPAVKIEATRAYGAKVVLYDPAVEKREEIAEKLMRGQDWVLVPPFDDPFVIAGQGTIGLEIFEDFPDVEQVIVPIGGGGLISGVATALKSLKPDVKIIGVEPEFAADAQESFRTGQVVAWTASQVARTLADGVRTLFISELTFAHIKKYVDDVITVSEGAIREAVRRLTLEHRLVIEPSGALPYAAWLDNRSTLPVNQNTVFVLSGGSVDPETLSEIIAP